MRLSEEERSVIREAVGEAFEGRARVWLFGSRVDDARRGGDIDLYVETDLPFERSFPARTQLGLLLEERLGEQKIDILVRHAGMGGGGRPRTHLPGGPRNGGPPMTENLRLAAAREEFEGKRRTHTLTSRIGR